LPHLVFANFNLLFKYIISFIILLLFFIHNRKRQELKSFPSPTAFFLLFHISYKSPSYFFIFFSHFFICSAYFFIFLNISINNFFVENSYHRPRNMFHVSLSFSIWIQYFRKKIWRIWRNYEGYNMKKYVENTKMWTDLSKHVQCQKFWKNCAYMQIVRVWNFNGKIEKSYRLINPYSGH